MTVFRWSEDEEDVLDVFMIGRSNPWNLPHARIPSIGKMQKSSGMGEFPA